MSALPAGPTGVGIGWRAEIELTVERMAGVDFVEVAEDLHPGALPASITALRAHEALDVVVDNVRATQATLGMPLALENIAPLLAWPDAEMTEGAFLAELCARTGAWLVLDVANLHASAVNLGPDPERVLDELPLGRVVHVHAAGGVERDGVYHDTHAHPMTVPVLDMLDAPCARHRPPAVLLERDDRYSPDDELAAELAALRAVHDRVRA